MDRRGFIGGVGAATLAGVSVTGCSSFVVTPVTPVNGVVRLPIRNHPQLEQPNGFIRIRPQGRVEPILILRQDNGGFAALSPICTHLQCTVNVQDSLIVCPCHGSTYDRAGRVLRGPAERPLGTYPARVEDGVLLITIPEAP